MLDAIDRCRRDRTFEINEAAERQRERLVGNTDAMVAATARTEQLVDGLAEDVSRMAAVADWALPAIARQLARTAERLGGIEQMLANPTETAAAEFYRRGSHALASGWWEESETDLNEAVRLYPYSSWSWFNLGIARLGEHPQAGQAADRAADAFASCARYGATAQPALAARAVLIAASIHRNANNAEASSQILSKYLDQLEVCAEIHLALGVHHGQRNHLIRALELDPGAAIDARMADPAGADSAAAAAGESQAGPVRRLRALAEAMTALTSAARHAALDVTGAGIAADLPAPGVDALLVARAILPNLVVAANRMTGEAATEQRRRPTAAQQAQAGATAARGESELAHQRESAVPQLVASIADGLATRQAALREADRLDQVAQTAMQERRSMDAVPRPEEAARHAVVAGGGEELVRTRLNEAHELARMDAQSLRRLGVGSSPQELADRIAQRQRELDEFLAHRERSGNRFEDAVEYWGRANTPLREQREAAFQACEGAAGRAAADANGARIEAARIASRLEGASGQAESTARESLAEQRHRYEADPDIHSGFAAVEYREQLTMLAHRATVDAQARMAAAEQVAEEAQRSVDAIAAILPAADLVTRLAQEASMPAPRLIPFDIGNQWLQLGS